MSLDSLLKKEKRKSLRTPRRCTEEYLMPLVAKRLIKKLKKANEKIARLERKLENSRQ